MSNFKVDFSFANRALLWDENNINKLTLKIVLMGFPLYCINVTAPLVVILQTSGPGAVLNTGNERAVVSRDSQGTYPRAVVLP